MMVAVLRKPSRLDNTKVKAYHPIALENILGEIMEMFPAQNLKALTPNLH